MMRDLKIAPSDEGPDQSSRNQKRDSLLVLEAVWEAQMRIRTPESRKSFRLINAGVAVTAVITPLNVITGISAIATLQARNAYNRSETRPEYRAAFNQMMAVMRMPSLERCWKLRVAALLVDYMRVGQGQRLLATKDHNTLVEFVEPNGPDIQFLQLTRRLPPPGTEDQDLALLSRVIEYAEGGGNSLVPQPDQSGVDETSGRGLVEMFEYAQIDQREVTLAKLRAIEESSGNSDLDNFAQCAISLDNAESVERLVALYRSAEDAAAADHTAEANNSEPVRASPVLFGFSELFKAVLENNRHPTSNVALELSDLHMVLRRVKVT